MRAFNTAGPCDPDLHYMVPAESRLPQARELIERGAYFVVHAPRQTGKTTTLRSLAKTLTGEGRLAALHFSCEAAKVARDDYGAAETILLRQLRQAAALDLPADFAPPAGWPADAPAGTRVNDALVSWASVCTHPLVLIFDEIDALRGIALESVLSQLRTGFQHRPRRFPASVVLCGLRDVRDYKLASGGDETQFGSSSPFNVKVVSLRLDNLTESELQALYEQHTADTGQAFTAEARQRAWALTVGQPWLVNALAREVVEEMRVAQDTAITEAHIDQAKERLVLARQTHLDSLVARLHEPRVRSVIGPLLAGGFGGGDPQYDDDLAYCIDLGLVSGAPPIAIANPIYREVIARVLASSAESQIEVRDRRAFVRPDGTLDVRQLLVEFAAFWREHGEVLTSSMAYHEVAPQLVLMAYLQRVVNGGGYIDREYGVGRGRIDLLLRWPHTDAHGNAIEQREAFELKVWADGKPDPLQQGLQQLDAYLTRLSLHRGVLVLFDRRSQAAEIGVRTALVQAVSPAGRAITVLRA